jgi:hypothetical protein
MRECGRGLAKGCIINRGSIISLPRSRQGACIETRRRCRLLELKRTVS